MTKKRIAIQILLCGVCVLLIAGAAQAAKTVANFPKPGVRPQGMGGAFVAVADDVNAIFYNPAGLALLEKHQVQLSHTDLFGVGIDYNYIAFTQAKFGVAWAHYGASDFLMGGGDYSFDMYTIAHAYQLDPATYLGINLKWLKGRYTAPSEVVCTRFKFGCRAESLSDEGFSVDIGALHIVDEATKVGLAVRDLFGRNKTVNSQREPQEDKFKPRVAVGFSRRTNPDFMFAVELDGLGRETIVRLGAEKTLQEELILRAGLDDDIFTAGFSYSQEDWEFLYSYKNSMGLGLEKTQRYGAIFRF